jgi:hypothetical protein
VRNESVFRFVLHNSLRDALEHRRFSFALAKVSFCAVIPKAVSQLAGCIISSYVGVLFGFSELTIRSFNSAKLDNNCGRVENSSDRRRKLFAVGVFPSANFHSY